jgi:hypothetical protein
MFEFCRRHSLVELRLTDPLNNKDGQMKNPKKAEPHEKQAWGVWPERAGKRCKQGNPENPADQTSVFTVMWHFVFSAQLTSAV